MADIYGGTSPAVNPGPKADSGTAGGRSLNTDQHAGSGPALTGSGVGVAGATLANGDSTSLALNTDGAGHLGKGDDALAVVKATFDKAIRFRLQFEPMYRQFANVRAVDQAAFPGSKVTLFRTGSKGLPLAVDPLSEYADPDAVALPGLEEKMDVSVDEYGAATVVTQRLQRFAWTEINPMQVEYVARSLRESTDAVYANAIFSTTGGWGGKGARQAVVKNAGTTGAKSTIALTANGYDDPMFTTAGLIKGTNRGGDPEVGTATGHIDSSVVRRIVAHFRSLGVAPMADGNYVGLITPDQAVALREETDAAGWRMPHLDGSWNGNLLNGTVGIWENVRFLESPLFYGMDKGAKYTSTDKFLGKRPTAGAGGKVIANSIFMGAEGIADVVVEEPHVVITPTTDRFNRLFGLGHIGTFGATVYDPNAILLVQALSE